MQLLRERQAGEAHLAHVQGLNAAKLCDGLKPSSVRYIHCIFAVGDVRSGSTKRVASAVDEGSIAVTYVHQVLDSAS